MENIFEDFVELGEEIGLFVVSDGSNEYIIGEKELLELENTAVSVKRVKKETVELVTKCSKTLSVSLI